MNTPGTTYLFGSEMSIRMASSLSALRAGRAAEKTIGASPAARPTKINSSALKVFRVWAAAKAAPAMRAVSFSILKKNQVCNRQNWASNGCEEHGRGNGGNSQKDMQAMFIGKESHGNDIQAGVNKCKYIKRSGMHSLVLEG
jgi:hypothetical protein